MKKILLLALTMLMAVQLFAQNVTATGTVKDIEGKALTGVSITEKGLTNSTITDADGNFQLPLSSGRVLVISMKGYETQVVEVGPDGKVPDIVMVKSKKVTFGVLGGINYGQSIIGNDESVYHEIKSSNDFGYSFGVFLNIKAKQTKRQIKKGKPQKNSTELGLKVFMNDLHVPDESIDSKIVYLSAPSFMSVWKSGVDKGFLITGGASLNFLVKGDDIILPEGKFSLAKFGFGIRYGFGYEFASGLGIKLTAYANILAANDQEKAFNYLDYAGEFALTYRFGKR